ncbi:chorismate mutase [Streptomyces sp. NPDC006285]|uniref:chorismate mutase n=1 Tax=Streptomyces sp. NPDC006285 TaxID=3364742 RepID=UPI00368A951E
MESAAQEQDKPQPPAEAEAHTSVAECRRRIDQIDRQLIALIKERAVLCGRVRRARKSTGASGICLARENQVIDRFSEALGVIGPELASLLRQAVCRLDGTVR